ncbi:MAG: hypothetical protein ACP5NW_03450 [Candidatus Woesearchaeota archaeon]
MEQSIKLLDEMERLLGLIGFGKAKQRDIEKLLELDESLISPYVLGGSPKFDKNIKDICVKFHEDILEISHDMTFIMKEEYKKK